ncbi:MAG: hypothetical protein ACTSWL_08225 [Promethearchaeota archaeon]
MANKKNKNLKKMQPLIIGIISAFFMALIAGIVMTTAGSNYITPGIPIHLMTFITLTGAIFIAFFINMIFKNNKKRGKR